LISEGDATTSSIITMDLARDLGCESFWRLASVRPGDGRIHLTPLDIRYRLEHCLDRHCAL